MAIVLVQKNLSNNCLFVTIAAPCYVLDHMKTMFPVCYEGYSETNEDKTAYNKPGWKPVNSSTSDHEELLLLCPKPWRYQDAEQTAGTARKWGQFSFYHEGGFVADLGYDNATGFSIIENLQDNNWLDKQTRAVIMDFSFFNPSVNILGVATYFYEVETSGLKAPFSRTEVISLDSTETASHQFYFICMFLFIVFALFYLARECYKLYSQRSRYFKSVWSWVEIFQVVFSVLVVVMYITRSYSVTSTIRHFQENIYANVSFQEAIDWLEAENAVLGILTFIVTTKLLRIIRFNDNVGVFSKTLKISARSLSSFSIVLLISFVAFLHFGVMIFGTGSERYSSVLKATYFQLELTLGRVKARPIQELAESSSTFGRVFSSLLLVSLTILGMNFFIAIINDVLLEAKNSVNESQLYDLVDGCDWQSTKERKAFFDAVSCVMKQSTRVERTSAVSGEKEATNLDLNSANSSSINFDLISQAIVALREKRIIELTDEKPSYTRRKLFFDKISNMIKKLKHENCEEQGKNKNEKKVHFHVDVTKFELQKLQKTQDDLFQRIDNIVQGYSEEDEEFHLLCQQIGVYNESFA